MSKNLSFRDYPTQFIMLDVIQGAFALAFAWILIKFFSVQQISQYLKRWKNRCEVQLTKEEGMKVWNGIQYAKRVYWTRMACLESSLAFVLIAIWKKRKVEWCVGIKLAPFQSHSWVEIQGKPFQETVNTKIYKKIISI